MIYDHIAFVWIFRWQPEFQLQRSDELRSFFHPRRMRVCLVFLKQYWIAVWFSTGFRHKFEGNDGNQDADESKGHKHAMNAHDFLQPSRHLEAQIKSVKRIRLNHRFETLDTCSEIKAERKNIELATPPTTLRVSATNHSPKSIHGTGVWKRKIVA